MTTRVKQDHPEIREWLQGPTSRYKYTTLGRPTPTEDECRCEICMNKWLTTLQATRPDWFNVFDQLKQTHRTEVAQMIVDAIPVTTCYSYEFGGYEDGYAGPFQCKECLDAN